MEFLSSEFSQAENIFPVNLVMQSLESVQNGDNAAGTSTFVVANLTFDPTAGFHEYRFDFIQNLVVFYADSVVLTTMNNLGAIPTHSGKIILTQWSNGNAEWSRGPPVQDSLLTVSYVKAYFDSMNETRNAVTSKACKNPMTPNATCPIPDQTVAPNPDGPNGNVTAHTFFFSQQTNQTPSQIVYKQSGASTNDFTLRVAFGVSLLAYFLAITVL